MPSPRRQSLLKLAIALLLGALTTIAIAWSLALTDISDTGRRSGQQIRPTRGRVAYPPMGGPAGGVSVRVYSDPGRVIAKTNCYGPEFTPGIGTPGVDSTKRVTTPPDETVPSAIRHLALPWLDSTPWPPGTNIDWREIQASGWPFLALASEYRLAPNFTYEQRFAITLRGERRAGGMWSGTAKRLLPLHPLWTGFALNTLLYASAWWALLLIPSTLRRRARARRHLCPHCAYDLSATAPGLPCPECGLAPATTGAPPV